MCCLSIHKSREKVTLPSACLRHQPPILQVHVDSRLKINGSVHSRTKEDFQEMKLVLTVTVYWL